MGWLTSVLTIAGYVVGSYFGVPALGALVGTTLGVLIEGAPDTDRPPNIDEIRVQGASEGDPIQYGIGSQYRVVSEVIWRGPLIAHEPGVEKHPTMYEIPICFSFGRTFTGKPALKIIELLFNGETLYTDYDEVNVTGTDIAATLTEITSWDAGTATSTVTQRYLDLTSSSTDLSPLVAGRNATVAGFISGGAVNNGTWLVLESTVTSARLSNPANALQGFVTAAAGPSVTIFQAAEAILSPTLAAWTTMEIGLGTVGQAPPEVMVFYEGAANVPGLSGLIWVAFPNLPLNSFGTAVPRVEARIKERLTTDLPTALKDIAVGMGADECEIDTIDAVGTFYGFAMRGARSIHDALSPFLLAYNLITQEKDLTLRILHRLAAVNKTIPESALGAQEGDRPDLTPRFSVTREDVKRLPAEVQFAYMDKDRHGETGSQVYRRIGVPLMNVVQHSVPIVLDKDQARRAAKRICFGSAVSSERHAIRLPPSQLDTYESDRLYSTSLERDRITLLTRILRGNNYELEVEGRRDDPDLFFNEDAVGGDSGIIEVPVAPTGDPLAVVADIPPLADADVNTPLLYTGAVRESSAGSWVGAWKYESAGVSYTLFDVASVEAPAGISVGTIPTGPVGIWDGATTVIIDLRGGTPPATSTDELVLAGAANWWLIGGEVIAAVNVTDLGGGLYQLTRLVRGLMDTADRVASHSANEPAMQVRPFSALTTRVYPLGDVGLARLYDAAPPNDVPDGVGAVTDTLNGSTVRPFSGTLPIGTRQLPAANDWTVTWTERTRRPLFPIFGSTIFDDCEPTEIYQVEVWNSGFAALIRTITSTASGAGSVVTVPAEAAPQVVYKSADQVTDFGSNQSTIRLRIYQVGASGLRSKKLETTQTG